MKLSLVILCYRSEEFAREFTRRTLEMFGENGIDDFELILVGNYIEGSGDRTPEIVRQLASGDPRIVAQADAKPPGGMMGWDLRTGLARATGDFVGFIDGDGQMPIGDVGRLYDLIRAEDFDLVKTYRARRGDGFVRKVLTRGYNFLFHVLFPGVEARDMNAKPKILRRGAFDKMDLRSDGWFIDAEIMIEAGHHRMKVGELPTEFMKLDGRGSFVSLGAVFEFLWNLLRSRVREFLR